MINPAAKYIALFFFRKLHPLVCAVHVASLPFLFTRHKKLRVNKHVNACVCLGGFITLF